MGDPRKQRKKYRGPQHPWQKLRIEEEKIILRDYGLKNKTEIWRMSSKLKNFARQAKRLNVLSSKESEKERQQVLQKLQKLGLLKPTAKLDDVLSLSLKDILERRLQTIVFRKGLSKSVKEARQLITHKHIMANGQKITSPSYLVKVVEQESITYAGNSPFHDPNHPKRIVAAPKAEKNATKEEKAEVKEAKEMKEEKEEKPAEVAV